jgi:hypothetical protein
MQFTPFSSINPLGVCGGRHRQQRTRQQYNLKKLSSHLSIPPENFEFISLEFVPRRAPEEAEEENDEPKRAVTSRSFAANPCSELLDAAPYSMDEQIAEVARASCA